MKVYIDNQLVQSPTDTLKFPSFTLRKKDENGGKAFSFTGDLTFIEADYTYIYQKLKTDVNAKINKIELKFVDNCCGNTEYKFEISHESLNWCEGKCSITAAAIEKSSENDVIVCLKNTLIWDNFNGFQNKQHPRMVYCNELRPNWLQHFVIICGVLFGQIVLLFTPILLVLAVIVTIINAIINAINFLLPDDKDLNTIDFDNDPSTNVFQEFKNLFNTIISFIVGCGRKHPSPLVRDYATNVCAKCGVNFSSSILNNSASSYYNTVYTYAPSHKGVNVNNTTTYWIDENRPNENGIMFFDKLKTVFNADYKVVGNTFYFERKDILNAQLVPFLDLTTYPSEKIVDVCWSWEDKDMPSYANFNYQKDAVNWLGHEANARWRDLVEWNNPYSPLQKGEHAPILEFSACRFRDDGIDEDILTKYENFPYVGPIIKASSRALIMNSQTCVIPMLLIWDPATGVANGAVSGANTYFPGFPNGGEKQLYVGLNQFFNYPYWFAEGYANNLYSNFHYIDNPKLSTFKGLSFTAELFYDCDLKNALDIYGAVKTAEGISKELKEINFNEKTGILTIKGIV